jgi:hypothetical protein
MIRFSVGLGVNFSYSALGITPPPMVRHPVRNTMGKQANTVMASRLAVPTLCVFSKFIITPSIHFFTNLS